MSRRPTQRGDIRLSSWLPVGSFTTVAHRAVALSLTRFGLATGLVHFYLSSYNDRRFLWGENGVLSQSSWIHQRDPLSAVSPYRLWRGDIAFEGLFHLGLLLALAFGLFGGRLLSAANWFMLECLHGQNPLVLDGGDNLLRLMLLLLILTENNLYLAIGARRRRGRSRFRLDSPTGSIRFFVHNCGVLLLVFQVVALYGAAVLWKLSGEPWRDGTALYYVSRATEFSYRPLPSALVDNPVLVTLLTYGVILAQMAIVWCTIRRKRPYVVLGTALVLHTGIALSMGLVTFSVVILSADALLVGDATWTALALAAARSLSFRGERRPEAGPFHRWRTVRPLAPVPSGDLRSQRGTPSRP